MWTPVLGAGMVSKGGRMGREGGGDLQEAFVFFFAEVGVDGGMEEASGA